MCLAPWVHTHPKFNFITTGCSFTAEHNYTIKKYPADWENLGTTWSHFCFAKMNPVYHNYVNMAMSGSGNLASMTNLIHFLETNKDIITPKNSLIGFNITGLDRVDKICSINDPLANFNSYRYYCKDSDIKFSWITSGWDPSSEQFIEQSCLTVLQCLSYLELKKFRYFFMLMNNPVYDCSPIWFKTMLNAHRANWVKFDDTIGMLEFSQKNNLITSCGHPNTQGHKLISDYVMEFLKLYE